MLDEIIALNEYVDIEEALSAYITEITLNSGQLVSATDFVHEALDSVFTTKFNYLSWQTMDILDSACSNHIKVNSKLVTCIDVICKRSPIHTEIARYLVINSVPEHVYRKLRLYVIANSEEAKAVITMGVL